MSAQPVPPDEELGRRWADLPAHVRQERIHRARHRRSGSEADQQVAYPVWVWLLGEIVVVGHPGEAYSQFQQQVRQHLPGDRAFCLNLVNGVSPGYLPPAQLYDKDVYQVWQTTLGGGSLERLTEHAIRRAGDLSEEGSP